MWPMVWFTMQRFYCIWSARFHCAPVSCVPPSTTKSKKESKSPLRFLSWEPWGQFWWLTRCQFSLQPGQFPAEASPTWPLSVNAVPAAHIFLSRETWIASCFSVMALHWKQTAKRILAVLLVELSRVYIRSLPYRDSIFFIDMATKIQKFNIYLMHMIHLKEFVREPDHQ